MQYDYGEKTEDGVCLVAVLSRWSNLLDTMPKGSTDSSWFRVEDMGRAKDPLARSLHVFALSSYLVASSDDHTCILLCDSVNLAPNLTPACFSVASRTTFCNIGSCDSARSSSDMAFAFEARMNVEKEFLEWRTTHRT